MNTFNIDKVRAALSQWQSLDSFGESLRDAKGAFDSKTFFRRSGLTFLREAWIGLQLARVLNALAIRLAEDAWPDIWIRLPDRDVGYEIVEVMEEGRKRGDEDWSGAIQNDPYEDWVKRAGQIPGQLENAVHKKCMKGYPRTAALLIYLNIDEWGIAQKETEAAMHDASSEARDKFRHVWVLWKGRFYLLWDNGVTSDIILTSEYWKEDFSEE